MTIFQRMGINRVAGQMAYIGFINTYGQGCVFFN